MIVFVGGFLINVENVNNGFIIDYDKLSDIMFPKGEVLIRYL